MSERMASHKVPMICLTVAADIFTISARIPAHIYSLLNAVRAYQMYDPHDDTVEWLTTRPYHREACQRC
jgi:hypothetical protein